MTTRDASGIDPALLRPGRFGYRLHMDCMRLPELLELLGLYYGTEPCTNALQAWQEVEVTASKRVRRLRQEEINEVRRCVVSLSQGDFSICGAVADSMCFAAPSLKAFLDALRRRHHSGR
ncbi:a44l protein-like protein [Trypanosoma rangeli]|uniref:A44l protein-like protein n=1 Tax=Trypanosoma rangeli TaxID=5698 RepID=A0A422MYN3_TRYRA|nr:a44l protein-like protein [Trypanosoma rangeli]RNE98336.1 a44l protein-like protein [Trypanosoma rangeli]|eukprot:RNE98336.1 a44l protein-like protein [Trypanosoma rangeli]